VLPACYTKTQATRTFSGRKRERCQKTCELDFSESPVAWHLYSWCNILQLTWCPWLKQILHRIFLHKLLHKNLSFTWTQLWVRWQSYWRYFKIVCYNTNATSKFQVMNFLYITLLTPRFLKWPLDFRKICGPQPLCVHVIHPFRRTCVLTNCWAQNILNL